MYPLYCTLAAIWHHTGYCGFKPVFEQRSSLCLSTCILAHVAAHVVSQTATSSNLVARVSGFGIYNTPPMLEYIHMASPGLCRGALPDLMWHLTTVPGHAISRGRILAHVKSISTHTIGCPPWWFISAPHLQYYVLLYNQADCCENKGTVVKPQRTIMPWLLPQPPLISSRLAAEHISRSACFNCTHHAVHLCPYFYISYCRIIRLNHGIIGSSYHPIMEALDQQIIGSSDHRIIGS